MVNEELTTEKLCKERHGNTCEAISAIHSRINKQELERKEAEIGILNKMEIGKKEIDKNIEIEKIERKADIKNVNENYDAMRKALESAQDRILKGALRANIVMGGAVISLLVFCFWMIINNIANKDVSKQGTPTTTILQQKGTP